MARTDIQELADEVAELMAARFGGAQRGEGVDLPRMMRRRGRALPRRLRGQAEWLADVSVQAGHPRIARQLDQRRVRQSHRALTRYLRPLGKTGRVMRGAAGVAASVMMALLIFGALALWYLVQTGRI